RRAAASRVAHWERTVASASAAGAVEAPECSERALCSPDWTGRAARKEGGAAARRLGCRAARRLGGSAAGRHGCWAARLLGGSAVERLGCWAARLLCCRAARLCC
ncbi:unnamed protein product, partial [Closterium sp. Naga37s-1]